MITKWFLLALVIYFALYFYQKEPPYRYNHVNWLEKAEQMRKMRYHGIEGMVCDLRTKSSIRRGGRSDFEIKSEVGSRKSESGSGKA